MKKWKKLMIVISVAAVIAVFFSPLYVAAEAVNIADTLAAAEISAVVHEEKALRERNVKHFLLEDGTATAVMYDAPVHYQKDNKWVDIDNTLVDATLIGNLQTGTIKRNTELTEAANSTATSAVGVISNKTPYYENNASDFKVQLPAAISSQTPIVVGYNGHSVRFCFENINTASAQVRQPLNATAQAQLLQNNLAEVTTAQAQAKIKKDHATTVWKNRSAISYAAVQPNVDLQYYINGETLKEALIFKKLPTATSFSYRFTYSGLQAVLEEDNSVTLRDKNNDTIFTIAAPFMFDSADGYSTDITVTLQQTSAGCLYILTPNRAWLEDVKRQYPVTLDPVLRTTQNALYIHDNTTQQSSPNTNDVTRDRMYVGTSVASTAKDCIYIKFTQWPSAIDIAPRFITSAVLNLNYYPQASYQSAHQLYVDVYRLTSAWNTNTITWNNSADVYGTYMSFLYIQDNRQVSYGTDSYDVTNWAKAHYVDPSTDYGIRLQSRSLAAKVNRACYISSDYSTNTSLRPQMVINYEFPYSITIKQFYDQAFSNQLGSTSAALNAITNYTQVLHDYFLLNFNTKIYSTTSAWTSPADACTHKNSDGHCNQTLSSTCDYYNGVYHCTNAAAALFVMPPGVTTIPTNVKIIKWTGNSYCEGCPVGNHTEQPNTAVSCDNQILMYYNLIDSSSIIPTIAHEFGHTLGCIGDSDDPSDPCVAHQCVMAYGNFDNKKLQRLQNLDYEAYCNDCRSTIWDYVWDNLST